MADLPIIGSFGLALQDAPLDDTVITEIETHLLMTNTLANPLNAPGALGGVSAKHAMQPLDMYRVENILRRLQPIARR